MQTEKRFSFWDGLWDFFASIRMTVAVLLTLAAASVIGTLIPQNESHEAYLQKYGEVLYKVFYVLDIFDMYHSWWFQLLILILTANIVVCSLERLSSLWKILFVKIPTFDRSSFQKLKRKAGFVTARKVEDLKTEYAAYIGKRFAYLRTEETDKGFCLFAEKGRKTRMGVYIVHFSVVLLLIGALIGSIFGFEGFVNIPEGESVKTIHLRNAEKDMDLGFEIRCEDFNVSFYETGAPKEYRSRLNILENGASVLSKDIIVNDPLRYKGINIYQSSYGKVPFNMGALEKEGVTVTFTGTESGMNYRKKLYMGKPVELPEGWGTFTLKRLDRSFLFMGQRDLGDTFVGTHIPSTGEPTDIYLPIRFSKFDKMRKNSSFFISVEGTAEGYYTGLQITHDPGVPLVYAGFIIMILGCYITFFMSHQRLCVEVVQQGGQSQVQVSGTANKNPIGMDRTVRQISEVLARMENTRVMFTQETC
jgi:cytochrome c biogenesis protein